MSSDGAPRRGTLALLGFLAAPTLVALTVACVAMQVRRPTAFELDLVVSGVAFESAGGQEALLVDKTAFSSLTMQGIDRGEVHRARFEANGEAPAGSPSSVPVRLSARDGRGATMVLSRAGLDAPAAGELDRVFLPPGGRAELAITPETPAALSLRVFAPSRILLSLRGAWLVDLLDAAVGPTPAEAAASTLAIEAGEDGSFVETWGTARGFSLVLTTPADGGPDPAPISNLRVAAIDLLGQGPTGEAVSTVSGDGTIGFPAAPQRGKVEVKTGHFVVLDRPTNFWIRSLELQPERHSIRLVAGGAAASLQSGPAGGFQEHAQTWFDSIWKQPRSVQLFALAAWFLPTTLAGYKLVKELRK